jgi:hypothetical protein
LPSSIAARRVSCPSSSTDLLWSPER